MTLDEIRASDKLMLTPADIADVLGCDAQSVRVAAKQRPELLGFSVTVIGSRVRIPRLAFLRFMGEGVDDGHKAQDSRVVDAQTG